MHFDVTTLTQAGRNLLTKASAGERIIWGKCGCFTQSRPGTTATYLTGKVASGNAVAAYRTSENTTHISCTADNTESGMSAGYANSFGLWAKLDGDEDETLVMVGYVTTTPATYFPLYRGASTRVGVVVNISVSVSDETISSINLDLSEHALATDLQAEIETREAADNERWHIYKDYWEALEKSKDGEWFSIGNDKPRVAKITKYGAIDLTTSENNPGKLAILQHIGQWVLCKAWHGTPNGYFDMCIGISTVADILMGGEITPRAVISTNIDHFQREYELLWENSGNFLYIENNTSSISYKWTSGDVFVHSGKFHRSTAGLVRVQLRGDYIYFEQVKSITPNEIDVNPYFARTENTNSIYDDVKFSSIKLAGVSIGLRDGGVWTGAIGDWWTSNYGYGAWIANVENAVITFDQTLRLNGHDFANQQWAIAFDCATSDAQPISSEGDIVLCRTVNGLTIPWHISSLIEEITGEEEVDFQEQNPISWNAPNKQPIGIFSCTIMGNGAFLVPWPGNYNRMVNRNGFILPYVDNPPDYSDQ